MGSEKSGGVRMAETKRKEIRNVDVVQIATGQKTKMKMKAYCIKRWW